jgi:hypothetical protein
MSLTMRVVAGPAEGHLRVLAGPGTVLIGRSPRAGLLLPSATEDDRCASKTHALLEFNPPLCRIYDLNSRNGTLLNGVRIEVADFQHGDELTFCSTRVLLEIAPGRENTVTFTPVDPEEDTFNAATLAPVAVQPVRAGKKKSRKRISIRCRACKRLPHEIDRPFCTECARRMEEVRQIVPGFCLVKELGRGGMGIVYQAVSETTQHRVAMKTILVPSAVPAANLSRFLREADILRQISHPNIVRFCGSGQTEGTAFLAMDYVHGFDLHRLLKRFGPFTIQNAVCAIRQALNGLAYAHNLGFVHRDLKPSNLMLEIKRKQTVKITDFGLARAYHVSQLSGVTMAGDVGGTPAFMPPEQIENFRQVSAPCDQYSMAATLYTLLTGKHAYDCSGPAATVLARILGENPIPILERRPDLPYGLVGVIKRAMSRRAQDRYASVIEFKNALEPYAKEH